MDFNNNKNNKKQYPSQHKTTSRNNARPWQLQRQCSLRWTTLLTPAWVVLALIVFWNDIIFKFQSNQQITNNAMKSIDVNDNISISSTKSKAKNNDNSSIDDFYKYNHNIDDNSDKKYTKHFTWFNQKTKTQIKNVTSIQDAIEQLASKPWTPITDTSWCVVPSNFKTAHKTRLKKMRHRRSHQLKKGRGIRTVHGLIYVKIYKTASSTSAGVALTIAKNVAKRLNYPDSCPASANHGNQFTRRQGPTFMFTMVREPAKRFISDYFFQQLGRLGKNFSESGFLNYASHPPLKSFQLNYIIPHNIHYNDKSRPSHTSFEQEAIEEIQNNVLNVYNFVGVTERLEESLVVLKMLMNVQDEDIIVLSAKQSPGYDDGGHNNTCNFISKSFLTPAMDEYMNSEFKMHNVDYILYNVINKVLDLTIESLGREKVQEGIRRHRELKEIATKYCTKEAIFPCSDTGERRNKTNCFFSDSGCGHECISRVLEQYKRGELPEKPKQL